MFIELTDHLRCPADHQEHFLVLIPESIEHRSVVAGTMGCPVCGREYPIEQGVLRFGPVPGIAAVESALTGPAAVTLLGLSGPGGYLALVGVPGELVEDVARQLPGVQLVAIDPKGRLPAGERISVLLGGGIACQRRSMRGVVLGPGSADDPALRARAAEVALPGRNIVGEGADPVDLELAASASGVWVATVSGTAG